ncbi:uncharacterized [Tachysurus ichikawai]
MWCWIIPAGLHEEPKGNGRQRNNSRWRGDVSLMLQLTSANSGNAASSFGVKGAHYSVSLWLHRPQHSVSQHSVSLSTAYPSAQHSPQHSVSFSTSSPSAQCLSQQSVTLSTVSPSAQCHPEHSVTLSTVSP